MIKTPNSISLTAWKCFIPLALQRFSNANHFQIMQCLPNIASSEHREMSVSQLVPYFLFNYSSYNQSVPNNVSFHSCLKLLKKYPKPIIPQNHLSWRWIKTLNSFIGNPVHKLIIHKHLLIENVTITTITCNTVDEMVAIETIKYYHTSTFLNTVSSCTTLRAAVIGKLFKTFWTTTIQNSSVLWYKGSRKMFSNNLDIITVHFLDVIVYYPTLSLYTVLH